MPNAFICDAIRTPIGRYGGALAHVRTDDLGAIPLRALMERNAGVDWSAVDDVIYGCANQAGEDNRNVARMALLLAGLAGRRAGHDRQSPVRLEHGRDRHRRARDQERRDVADDRRRRREHVARAVRHGQGRQRVLARREDRGHDDRLALRQPADESASTASIRCPRPPRTWPRNSRFRAQTRMHSRCAASSVPRRRLPPAGSPRKSSRSSLPAKKGDPVVVDRDEHPRETTIGSAREAQGRRASRRHGDRGQRVRRERRRLRRAARVRGRRRPPRPYAAGARRRRGGGGRGAAHHGHRSGAGDAQGAREGRADARRDRRHRAERGLRGAGAWR